MGWNLLLLQLGLGQLFILSAWSLLLPFSFKDHWLPTLRLGLLFKGFPCGLYSNRIWMWAYRCLRRPLFQPIKDIPLNALTHKGSFLCCLGLASVWTGSFIIQGPLFGPAKRERGVMTWGFLPRVVSIPTRTSSFLCAQLQFTRRRFPSTVWIWFGLFKCISVSPLLLQDRFFLSFWMSSRKAPGIMLRHGCYDMH